jgi:hypothetical protein
MAPLSVSTIDFRLLSPVARDNLQQEMLEVDRSVFTGAKPADLLVYLNDPRATQVKVVLYRDGARLVGQNIIPLIELVVDGRAVTVLGSVAGVLPRYRRSRCTQLDALRVALKYRLGHPTVPTYFATAMLHPRVYQLFTEVCSGLYPRPDTPTPISMAAVVPLQGCTVPTRCGASVEAPANPGRFGACGSCSLPVDPPL